MQNRMPNYGPKEMLDLREKKKRWFIQVDWEKKLTVHRERFRMKHGDIEKFPEMKCNNKLQKEAEIPIVVTE